MRSTLLHASGREMVALGVNSFRIFRKGDLIVELKWVNEEPVMLLYKQTLGTNSTAYMLEHKDAYQYAQSDGNATKDMVIRLAANAARALGAEHDKDTRIRIMDAILNFMPDLLMMPPPPKQIVLADQPTGENELSVKVNGVTVAEAMV